MHRSGLILYCSRIRKNVTNRQKNREQAKGELNYRGNSNPMNRRVERANMKIQLVSLFIDLKEWE